MKTDPKRPRKKPRITLGIVVIISGIIGFIMGLSGASPTAGIVVFLIILVAYEVYKWHNRNHKEQK